MAFVVVYAQQEAQYSQYMYNRLAVNPAYAAKMGAPMATLLYRGQWIGFEGAPRTFTFSIQGLPFEDERHGVGLFIISDGAAQYVRNAVGANYAFRWDLDVENHLMFGVQLALLNYQFRGDITILHQPDDPAIPLTRESIFKPDASAGIFYHNRQGYVGFSVIHLVRSRLNLSELNQARLAHHFFFTGGYDFILDDKKQWILSPSFFIKGVKKAPVQIDLNTNLTYKDLFWVGFTYRHQDALALLLGLWLSKHQFRVGYSYDVGISRLRSSSHEVMVSYFFHKLHTGKPPRFQTPRFF